jgi:hypothetical protein
MVLDDHDVVFAKRFMKCTHIQLVRRFSLIGVAAEGWRVENDFPASGSREFLIDLLVSLPDTILVEEYIGPADADRTGLIQ